MNAPEPALAAAPLAQLAFAALAPEGEAPAGSEADWLAQACRRTGAAQADLGAALAAWFSAPPAGDRQLHAITARLQLRSAETLALALCCAVELDAMAGRVLAWLQHPSGGSRPTPGLIAALVARLDPEQGDGALAAIVAGKAREAGLLQLEGENRPLPEAVLRVPMPLVLALAGLDARWPGIDTACANAPPLAGSQQALARCYGEALTGDGGRALAIRCGHPREARALADAVAGALDRVAAFVAGDPPAGLGPWLWLTGRVPVICAELAPGERRSLPALPGYAGPILVATGPDGGFERDGEPAANWRVAPPTPEERVALWQAATGDAALAADKGRGFRHSAGRIDILARAARFQATLAGRAAPSADDLIEASRNGAAADLGALAELLPESVLDSALVLPRSLHSELMALAARCLGRDTLAEGLGESSRTRFRSGVRALLYGASGTGKTLAVSWLASRLGLPLYRVDLASVTSKYIGETEKNLSQLFARAEHAEVVLMFDEADSLFGKRTDVKDSNDRFANAQTNYLLQRIESFEGIAILTSNSRSRFDTAFARRLDAIIEFPLPAPEERRSLWQSHLGEAHALAPAELNRLAAGCDLAGGHIRNVVLAAAASARTLGQPLAMAQLRVAIGAEYRKLGKPAPSGI